MMLSKNNALSMPLACSVLLPELAHAADLKLDAAQTAANGSPGLTLAFWLLGSLTVLAAVFTITRRNPVTAALGLVLTLFLTGGLYLVLHATFLAAIQVLVYAGAVMVLFLFVVMSVSHCEREEFGWARGWWFKLVGLGALALFAERLLHALSTVELSAPKLVADSFGDIRSVGKLLFSDYLVPFEAIAIPLLVAIVAAVMVTRRPTEGDSPRQGARDGSR